MNHHDLAYQETTFCWSPKLQKRIKVVGLELVLHEIAESRPDIEDYSFPGPALLLDDQLPHIEHTVRMTAKFTDGVTGAIEYLSANQVKSGVAPRIAARAQAIGLRIEIYDRRHLKKQEKHYSAWRQMTRFLHPLHRPQELGVTRQLQNDDWPLERLSISDICKLTKVDRQTALVATAYLIHRGILTFDAERGHFDLRTKVWRAKP